MDGLRAGAQRNLLVQAEVFRLGQADSNAFALEFGGNDAGFGLEGKIASQSRKALHEASKAAGAVAAHFAGAAVTVVELPGPVGFSRGARNQDNHAICAHASMAAG